MKRAENVHGENEKEIGWEDEGLSISVQDVELA
jgi:hypothetical protein